MNRPLVTSIQSDRSGVDDEAAPPLPALPASAVEQLLDRFAEHLAAALAPRLAAALAHQAAPAPAPTTRRLLSLDALVAQLPAAKSERTWKRWFYERTRKGQVPGCHRLGGRLFFDPEQTIPWLTGTSDHRLDLSAGQSLHQPSMGAEPSTSRPGGGR